MAALKDAFTAAMRTNIGKEAAQEKASKAVVGQTVETE